MANGEKVFAAAIVEIFWLESMKGLEKESVLVVNKVEDKFGRYSSAKQSCV